ncbi:Satratoxin biosynthesis SC23 cluster protein [Paramyrothecium foliicola]|nr:Satratoxin biosynthesis SC23 cluster protein [Paramyrothecium foliicola]
MSGLAAVAADLPNCAHANLESFGCTGGLPAYSGAGVALQFDGPGLHDQRGPAHQEPDLDGVCGVLPRQEHNYLIVLVVFFALSALAVFLRIVARLQARVPMWWDDFIIGLSFLGCLAFSVVGLTLTKYGLGTDIWAVPPDNVTLILKRMYVLFILYITSRDLVRLSILLFYQRIFGKIPVVRRLIHFTFAFILACWAAFAMAIIFGCKPIDHFWKGWDGESEGHCVDKHVLFWAGAVIVTAIDIWIMLIPLPFIARLKFPLRKKILTGVMFTFGIFVVIVSLYRFSTISRFTLSKNPTYDFVDVGIWSGLELYVGIICACMPHIHNLLRPIYVCLGVSSTKSKPSSSGPCDGAGSSGNSSQRHWRLQDANSGFDGRIQATTTVDVKQYRSESQTNLSPGTDMGYQAEEIELGTKTKGETRGKAWS